MGARVEFFSYGVGNYSGASRVDIFSGGVDIFLGGVEIFSGGVEIFSEGLRLYPGGVEIFSGRGGGWIRNIEGAEKRSRCV